MECPKCRFENPDNTNFCGNCASRLGPLEDNPEDRTETIDFKPLRLKTGSTLAGRYKIIEELGFGGMGRVYKAVDKEIGERVAIKLIRPDIAANRKLIERFQNELITTRRIAHRHVCRMYDLGRDGDTRFITMEYVSGEDLKKSLIRMGPLMTRKVLNLGIQICQGLSEAHRLGVIHRDLKPGNIMIDMQGNVRIMDFGIAISQGTRDLTDSGVVVGTPKYFSPEQVEGKTLDQRSDIYSFGVILYEMVTGHVPFEGDTTLIIAYKHMSEAPRNPREFNAQLPKELSQVILKCLEKDPQKRYRTAEEICAALTKIKEELPTTETTIPRTKLKQISQTKFSRPRPKFMRVLGALLLVIFVLGSVFIVYDKVLKKDTVVATSVGTDWVNSIVILPFEHLNPEPGQENLWISFTEAIIRKLSKFQEVKVISLNSALSYKDSGKDAREVSQELDVKNVISGTISIQADKVTAIIKREEISDNPFAGEATYTGHLDNLSELQDKIVVSLAGYLGLALVMDRYENIPSKDSEDVEANRHYQDGRSYELKYYSTYEERDFLSAVDHYSKAVSADPNFALAYWRLGNLHEALYNIKDEDKDEALNQMLDHYKKAYAVDRYSAEANIGMGWYYFYQDDFDSAYQLFKKGYELDSNNAEINFLIGSFLKTMGLYPCAIKHYDRGFELDPYPLDFSLWHGLRAKSYSNMGRFEEAAYFLSEAIQIKQDPWLMLEYAAQLIYLKKYREAEIQIQEAEKTRPMPERMEEDIRHTKALLFAAHGEREKALALIKDEDDTYRQIITSIYALLDLKVHALPNIQKGISVGLEMVRETLYSYPFLMNNPCYESLRDDPQFMEILKNEKAKFDAMLKKYGDL